LWGCEEEEGEKEKDAGGAGRGDNGEKSEFNQDLSKSTTFSSSRPFGALEPKYTPPPLVILRLRTDHLVTSRWNLTAAAAEFMGRASAQAAGSNFLALWGPSSHSHYCNWDLCPDLGKTKNNGTGCYTNGRLDDAFAFGTPPVREKVKLHSKKRKRTMSVLFFLL
jgi:hypothetical protein